MNTEPIYAIHMYRDDLHENYCGCWHVPAEPNDPICARVRTAGFGLARDEDGTVSRSWFVADEIEEQREAARRTVEGYVVVEDVTRLSREVAR